MSASPIPKTAPFADDEIESLNRVVGPATPMQRAWLAGFLAGLDAPAGTAQPRARRGAAAGRAADDPLRDRVRQFREARRRCREVARASSASSPSLVDMADLEIASLKDVKKLIVIAATWGEGEPPARAIRAYKELMSDAAPRLDGVEFGVLALGDTAYVGVLRHRQGARRAARSAWRKARRGARRLRSRFRRAGRQMDRRHTEDAGAGSRARHQGDRGRFRRQGRAEPRRGRGGSHRDDQSQFVALRQGDLSTSNCRSTAPAPAYKPGDSLDLYAENDPAYVDALLQGGAAFTDAALRAEFIKSRDVTTLSLKTMETYAGFGQRLREGVARRRRGEELDRRPPADRSGAGIPGRARCRETARADAAARAARLFDRVIARAKSARKRIC